MTAPDAEGLLRLLARIHTILMDFDGPICAVFAGYPAATIAEELRQLLRAHGAELPTEMGDTDDPLQVLRLTPGIGRDDLVGVVATALREAELRAVEQATPTPHVEAVISAVQESGRRLGVVSNNSTAAVESYLNRRGLGRHFVRVIGRSDGLDPRHLKPGAHLVRLAMAGMGAGASSTILVGDSATDIRAAHAAGIPGIGYANKPGKDAILAEAGADVVVRGMADLAEAVRSTG